MSQEKASMDILETHCQERLQGQESGDNMHGYLRMHIHTRTHTDTHNHSRTKLKLMFT